MKRGALISLIVIIGVFILNFIIPIIFAEMAKEIVVTDKLVDSVIDSGFNNDYKKMQEDQAYQEIMKQNQVISEISGKDNLRGQLIESQQEKSSKKTKEVSGAIGVKTKIPKNTKVIKASEFDKKVKEDLNKIRENKKKEVAKAKAVTSKKKKKTSVSVKNAAAGVKRTNAKVIQSISEIPLAISGNVVRELSYYNLELPNIHESPGEVKDIYNSKLSGYESSMLGFVTGNAIKAPDWSYDGSKEGNFIWREIHSGTNRIYNFKLSIESNFSKLNSNKETPVNGIIYSKGYYLDDYKQKWEEFLFNGIRVGNTGWLRERGEVSITLSNYTSKDYSIFLAYSCLKWKDSAWDCNKGKWVIFVIGTGNVSYNQKIGETPLFGYKEIKDLNISDIPSILKQFNVSLADFEPLKNDAGLLAQQINFENNLGETRKIDFYVMNWGNRNLTNLTFELDVGESNIAEVVSAELPNDVPVNKSRKGSATLYLKEKGNFKFNLFVKPKEEEVDTSDNLVKFNFTIGGPVERKFRTDSLNESWNRKINYTIKEGYKRLQYNEGSNLYTISGTNKIRNVWGGYWKGKSINPTMEVKAFLKLSYDFLAKPIVSIDVYGKMLTGDREIVSYYLIIVNNKTGKKYATSQMESMYKYSYRQKELIPDFKPSDCYIPQVVLLPGTNETIDIIEPAPFGNCTYDFNTRSIRPPLPLEFKAERILKLDGNYVLILGGFEPNFFDKEVINVRYKVIFRDPNNPSITYSTPLINSTDTQNYFKIGDVFKNKVIDYNGGMTFPGEVVFIDIIKNGSKVDTDVKKFFEMLSSNYSISFKKDLELILKDNKINVTWNGQLRSISKGFNIASQNIKPWSTQLLSGFSFISPRYMPKEYLQKILLENDYYVYVKDLTKNEIVFNKTYYCSKYSQSNFIQDSEYYSCLGVLYDPSFDDYASSVAFESGHYYGFYFNIYGPSQDNFFIDNNKNKKFMYVDAFQLIANNPLLRTRFMGLENHPFLFKSHEPFLSFYGSDPSESYKKNNPYVFLQYEPKNTKLNYEKNIIEVTDTNLREIELKNLETFGEKSFIATPEVYGDYILQNRGYDPIFKELIFIIYPLNNTDSIQEKRAQFNCKLGRFDMLCERTNQGYDILYFDETYNMLYRIILNKGSGQFIKDYRNNPKIYDAVIYDILTEIERNPIIDFKTLYYFENDLKKLEPIGVTQKNFPFSLFKQSYEKSSETCTNNYHTGRKNIIDSYFNSSLFYGNPVPIRGLISVYDFTDSKYLFKGNLDEYPVCFIYNLNFTPFHKYKVEIESNSTPPWFPYEFEYSGSYKDFLEKNKKYLKKIPELNSTLMGPIINHESQICSTYLDYFNGSEYCLEKFYNYLEINDSHPFPQEAPFIYRASTLPFSISNGRFEAFFSLYSVNPYNEKYFYPGEEIFLEEIKNNTFFDRAKKLDSNRFYIFSVYQYNDMDYFIWNSPKVNYFFDDKIDFISCTTVPSQTRGSYNVNLRCQWSNLNEMKVYSLDIIQMFKGREDYSENFSRKNGYVDFKENYAGVVLEKYLERFPPTPLLNLNLTFK